MNHEPGTLRRIDLEQIPEMGSIKLLYVETSATATGSLAIVHYADNGQEQRYGLRLDLDKRVYLDHLDDPQKDREISSTASTVASAVFDQVWELDVRPKG